MSKTMKLVHTVTQADVGCTIIKKPPCKECGAIGRHLHIGDCLGYVQQVDIGKRIYRNEKSNTLHVENDEQLATRLK